jgi:hypothetical protein
VVLDAVWSTALPLTEISALAVRRAGGPAELVAVGDDDFGVLTVPLSDDRSLGPADRHELRRDLPRKIVDDSEASEFEGVACDGAGRVFLLQEALSRVLVLRPGLDSLLVTIRLEVKDSQPDFGADWKKEENRRGEAILLLRDGNLLVLKQREPTVLIEFGPEGAEPLGIGPHATLPHEDRFEHRAAIDEHCHLPKPLPGGDEARAEGLVVGADGTAFVGIDTKVPGDNLLMVGGLRAGEPAGTRR